MVMRQCAVCGTDFEAKRSDAKCCSSQCRQKLHQAKARQNGSSPNGSSPAVGLPDFKSGSSSVPADGIVATVEANLRAAGQLDSVAGQSAMGLAEHLSRGAISGSERAALTKALHETMQRAMAAAGADANDPLEAIKRRVRAKRGQALNGGGDGPTATPAALVDFEVWQRTHEVPDELVGATVGPVWDWHFDAWCAARLAWAEEQGWPGGESARESDERHWLGRRPWDVTEI